MGIITGTELGIWLGGGARTLQAGRYVLVRDGRVLHCGELVLSGCVTGGVTGGTIGAAVGALSSCPEHRAWPLVDCCIASD